jgi:probable HAF family extracellular repeat protein
MKRFHLKLEGTKIALAMVLALVTTVPCWAGPREITSKIDVPGAVVTVASGINPDGSIVGWYCLQLPCNAPHIRGFLLSGGVFTYIDVPNSADHPSLGTQPRYISPQGIVIGAYFSQLFHQDNGATVPRYRGFAWYNGAFTYFDAPDSIYDNPSWPHSIIPRAINAKGEIVGCIHDKNTMDSMHGFLYSDGAFTRLDMGMTMNNGITSAGDIVGLDGASPSSYHIDKNGAEERIMVPWADVTSAWDINPRGEIVGSALTKGVSHAFLRSPTGDSRMIDPAGALSATAFGIASNGNIVGQFTDGTGAKCSSAPCVHGFVIQRGN